MPARPTWLGRGRTMAAVVAALAGACALSWLSRQDKNWDLQNYHLYNAWALANGRLGIDLFAAGIQTYLNPLLDLPYYFLSTTILPDHPRIVAALAGLPFGLLVLPSFGVAREVARSSDVDSRTVVAVCAAIGLTGSTVIAEIGTTFGDVPVAALMLAALLALLIGAARERWGWHATLAGALAGGASGLKLTQIVFSAALPVALLAAGGGWRRIARGNFLLGAGWLAAFSLVEGWWGFRVNALFGNPVFPLLNNVFGSPWAAPVSLQDTTYLPASAWRAVFLPFTLMGQRAFVVGETAFRDPRLALVWLSFAAIGMALFLPKRRALLSPVARMALAWTAASYVLWEWKFSIIRYAVGVEATAGVPVLVAMRIWAPRLRGRALLGCLFGVVAVAVAATNYTNWGRMKGYAPEVFDIAPINIPDGSAVIFAGKPLAFLAPFARGRSIFFVGLDEVAPDTALAREIAARVARAPRSVVIAAQASPPAMSLLERFGMKIDPASCRPVPNPYRAGVSICAGRPDAPR